jgi:UDP-N-acetylmuramate dehydrogenase
MFKNPRGQRAADLIADAGFRGARIGGAVVSERNPNFVEASEGCASEDVKRLLNLIQTQARERVGVELERELEIW